MQLNNIYYLTTGAPYRTTTRTTSTPETRIAIGLHGERYINSGRRLWWHADRHAARHADSQREVRIASVRHVIVIISVVHNGRLLLCCLVALAQTDRTPPLRSTRFTATEIRSLGGGHHRESMKRYPEPYGRSDLVQLGPGSIYIYGHIGPIYMNRLDL